MRFKIWFLFILVTLTPALLFGLEVSYAYVKDEAKHEFNKKLLNSILEKKFIKPNANLSPASQAKHLNSKIAKVAHELINQGFCVDAYAVPDAAPDSIISFSCHVLWEGEKNVTGPVPITFFIYIWPSEKLALAYNASNPLNCRYHTIIHSHPISCSFAVLQGSLVQNNYVCTNPSVKPKLVRFVNEEIFNEGEGDVDLLTKPFIHQLYNRDCSSKVCLSLHAYGLSSESKVWDCFDATKTDCTFQLEALSPKN